jgi:predicted NBD/HSP70 family sugar kinase
MPEPELIIALQKNAQAIGQNYRLGIEDDGDQIRVAARASDKMPNLAALTPFLRTNLYAIGSWRKPTRYRPQGAVTQQDANRVVEVVTKFLEQAQISRDNIIDVQYTTIVSYPDELIKSDITPPQPFRTDTVAVDQALENLFSGRHASRSNTSQSALNVELKYGAGQDILPASPLFYITVSCNLNMDMEGTASNVIFAGGIRHMVLNPDEVEKLGQHYFPQVFHLALRKSPCEICQQSYCLSQFASGYAMADIAAEALNPDQRELVSGRALQAGEAQVTDVGGTSRYPGLDGYSVLQAAFQNEPISRNIVRQAGVALGLITADVVFRLIPTPLVVIGGAVPMGSAAEITQPFGLRMGVDTTVQRVLTLRDYPETKVTRSRFAGFTGLLGATLD